MQPIAIEKTWNTKEWQHCPFAFCLGVSVVNAQQGHEMISRNPKVPTLQFRRTLAYQLLYNNMIPEDAEDDEGNRIETRRSKQ